MRHQNVPAAYLIFMNGTKTLLLRRFNTGYADGKYSLVAGHVDPGETFSRCIIREAKEEAGVQIDIDDLEFCHILHRDSHSATDNERIDVFFEARRWTGEIQNMEPNKCDDLAWFDIHDLPENTLPHVRTVLENITRNIQYSEYGWNN